MSLNLGQASKIIKMAKRLAEAENVVTRVQAEGQKPTLEQTRNAHKAFRLLHVYVHQLIGQPAKGAARQDSAAADKGG